MDVTPLSQYLHWAVTAILAFLAIYAPLRANKKDKQSAEQQDNTDDIGQLKTDLAVLQARLSNETHMLERLSDKLDRLLEKL